MYTTHFSHFHSQYFKIMFHHCLSRLMTIQLNVGGSLCSPGLAAAPH